MADKPQCPICFSGAAFWAPVEDMRFPKPSGSNGHSSVRIFNLFKCSRCGHGFFHPGVDGQEELNRFYNEDYARDYNPDIRNENFIKRQRQYRLDLDYLKKFLPEKSIQVLDFGCSTGQFLNAMPDSWKKSGFEVNKYEIEYIKRNYKHIKIFSKIEELKKNSYDLITLRGVIEHLFSFEEMFSLIKASLKKGGMVYICATPDFNSPCSVVYRPLWNQIGAPLHYHQFTAASLSILFARHGFGLKAMHYDYLDTAYANFNEDAVKFIKNVESSLNNGKLQATDHAYPGTMINILFSDMGGLKKARTKAKEAAR